MYWAMSLKSFAISLVGVFVPAYLYKLGYPIRAIILYFLIRELVELVAVYPTTSLMSWFSVRRTFTAGCFLTLVNLGLLYVLPTNPQLFALTAISEALAISLFFLPFHFMFSAAVTKKGGGSQVGFMDIIVSLVTAFGPLLGGLIATKYGLRFAFLVAIVFVLIAIGPILKGSDKTKLKRMKFGPVLQTLFSRDSVSNMGFGVTEMVATIIWPLFIFLLIKSYSTVGLIVSASLLVIIILDYAVGKVTDKGKVAQLLNAGAFSSAFIHLTRIAASTIPGVAAFNFASDATHTLFRIPWTAEFYKHAGATDRQSYIASMELAVCFGRSLLWLGVIGLSYFMVENTLFLAAFFIGAAGSLLVPKIVR